MRMKIGWRLDMHLSISVKPIDSVDKRRYTEFMNPRREGAGMMKAIFKMNMQMRMCGLAAFTVPTRASFAKRRYR